jgi:hypothetical protein
MCTKLRSGYSSRIIPDPGALNQFFGLKILKFSKADPDPGFRIFLTLDPRWKKSDPG